MIKKLRVTVDGRPFDVTVEVTDELAGENVPMPAPIRGEPAPTTIPPTAAVVPNQPSPSSIPAGSPVKTGSVPGDVPSPLAGRVITVVVKVGQEVNANDHLLTLEAMKMNTFVFAPRNGKVTEIKVLVGDAVDEGQALVTIA